MIKEKMTKNPKTLCTACGHPIGKRRVLMPTTDPKKRMMCVGCAKTLVDWFAPPPPGFAYCCTHGIKFDELCDACGRTPDPKADITENPKPCLENWKKIPFTSEHVWRADHHNLPGGECERCGKDYRLWVIELEKRILKTPKSKPRAEWDSICYREVVRLAVNELIPFEQIEPFKRLATLLDLKVNDSLSRREQEVSFNERERLLEIVNKLAKKRGYQIRLGIFDETSLETFLDCREQEVKEEIANEIETAVEIVLGYVGDETEELAAKNRWKILKPKWMNRAIEAAGVNKR